MVKLEMGLGRSLSNEQSRPDHRWNKVNIERWDFTILRLGSGSSGWESDQEVPG